MPGFKKLLGLEEDNGSDQQPAVSNPDWNKTIEQGSPKLAEMVAEKNRGIVDRMQNFFTGAPASPQQQLADQKYQAQQDAYKKVVEEQRALEFQKLKNFFGLKN